MTISGFLTDLMPSKLNDSIIESEKKRQLLKSSGTTNFESKKIVAATLALLQHFSSMNAHDFSISELKTDIFNTSIIRDKIKQKIKTDSRYTELLNSTQSIENNLLQLEKNERELIFIVTTENTQALKNYIAKSTFNSADIKKITFLIFNYFKKDSSELIKHLIKTNIKFFLKIFTIIFDLKDQKIKNVFLKFFNNEFPSLPIEKLKVYIIELCNAYRLNEVIYILDQISSIPHLNELIKQSIKCISSINSTTNEIENIKSEKIKTIFEKFHLIITDKTYQDLVTNVNDPLVRHYVINFQYPELNHNEQMIEIVRDLITFIENPKELNFKLNIPFEEPADCIEWAAEYLVKKLFQITGLFSRPQSFVEPYLFKEIFKESSIEVELLHYIYQSDDINIERRARIVLKKIGKYDPFIKAFFNHCDRLAIQEVPFCELENIFNDIYANRQIKVKLPALQPHKVSKQSSIIFSNTTYPYIIKNHSKVGAFREIYVGSKNLHMADLSLSLEEIGKHEGFKVIQTKSEIHWLRDNYFKLNDQIYLTPQLKSEKMNNIWFQAARLLKSKKNFSGLDPVLDTPFMGQVYSYSSSDTFNNRIVVKKSRFYFEGGNLFRAKNSLGQSMILSGAMNVLCSYIVAKQEGFFDNVEFKQRAHLKLIELENQNIFTTYRLKETINALTDFAEFTHPTDEDAKVAIAQIEVIKEGLSEDLNGPVLFLESGYGFDQNQRDLHIDMYLMPLDNGIIAIHDDAKSIEILEVLLEQDNLHPFEKLRFKKYLESAKKLHKRDGARLINLKAQLEANGFTTISIPGRYITMDGEINYMNGIVGNGNKSEQFVILSGFKGFPGERYLRDAITQALHAVGVDSVYFTGRTSKRYLNSEPIDLVTFYNMSGFGGIHCRTLEM